MHLSDFEAFFRASILFLQSFMTTLKEKTAKGLLWGGVSNGILQLLNAAIGIFLARKLSQDDYGMVGMLAIFTALGTSLQEGGFIGALNKRKNATYNDFNAVFWTSVGISVTIYTILFFCAPLIARFYGVKELTPLARYIFLSFVISSLSTAPRAYLFRNMMVRETSIMTIISLAVSGVVAIWMAYQGMAYWGIATQTVVYITLIAAQSFYFAKWKPSLHVDFTPIREMIGFSSRLILTNVFNIINQNVFSVILGKMYIPKVVGDYTQANKWTTMGSSLISNMVYGIAQPVFTKVEEDRDRQKAVFRKLLRFTAFIWFPLMLGVHRYPNHRKMDGQCRTHAGAMRSWRFPADHDPLLQSDYQPRALIHLHVVHHHPMSHTDRHRHRHGSLGYLCHGGGMDHRQRRMDGGVAQTLAARDRPPR